MQTGNAFIVVSILITSFAFFNFVKNIGKTFLIHEVIIFYACMIYLIFPIIGYTFFNSHNELAQLWVTYMRVPASIYFGFALPAILSFYGGLYLLKGRTTVSRIKSVVLESKIKLEKNLKILYYLIIIGIISNILYPFIPSYLQYVFRILTFFQFAGLVGIILKSGKSKFDYLTIGLLVFMLLRQAVDSTMFTIIVYMGLTVIGIFLIELRMKFYKKLALIILLLVCGIALQFTKTNYRALNRNPGISNISFGKLLILNFSELKNVKNANSFFLIYNRGNQGLLLSQVMEYIPSSQSFDQGKRLFLTILSSFVPRLFWPDKPMAGGKENMKYYADREMGTTSMNVGPFGEAYGSFGVIGGIIYLFFFGLYIGIAIHLFLTVASKFPLLIIWIPVLFFELVYSLETDTLQAINSVVKTSFFLFIFFKFFPFILRGKT